MSEEVSQWSQCGQVWGSGGRKIVRASGCGDSVSLLSYPNRLIAPCDAQFQRKVIK